MINQESSDKNSFEISQELCKDAMVEKIILISLAYLCTATEMRLIVAKTKSGRGNTLTMKDSEMFHAKALHISSIFLPKECPIVHNMTKSYRVNYLKEKRSFDLNSFLQELGVISSCASEINDEISSSLNDLDIDEGYTNMQKNSFKNELPRQIIKVDFTTN